MKRGGLFDRKLRVAAAIGVTVALGTAGPAAAKDPLAQSKVCRATVAGEMAKLGKLTNVLIDKCHKLQLKGGLARTNCNVIGSAEFDPLGKYAGYKTKAHDKIALKCPSPGADPELGNFQAGDPFARLLPELEKDTANIAVASVGDDTVAAAAKDTAKCINTIAKWHAKLFYDVLNGSNKAQKVTDKTATVFGRLLEANVASGSATQASAAAAIAADCAGVSGIDACTNAGSCLDATRTAAQLLARELYHGNNTCEPLIGTRTVTVTINTPEALAGMKVDLDYPQNQIGLVGTEQSELVADAVSLTNEPAGLFKVVNDRESDMSIVVGATTPFVQNGDQVTITFDACAAKERTMCNRAQQVMDCAIAGKICVGGSRNGNICTVDSSGASGKICNQGPLRGQTCGVDSDCGGNGATCVPDNCPGATCPNCCVTETFEANPDVCTDPSPLLAVYPEGIIVGTPGGCCPGDNACIGQNLATTCSVTDPVRADGTNVPGVTCSVSVSGT